MAFLIWRTSVIHSFARIFFTNLNLDRLHLLSALIDHPDGKITWSCIFENYFLTTTVDLIKNNNGIFVCLFVFAVIVCWNPMIQSTGPKLDLEKFANSDWPITFIDIWCNHPFLQRGLTGIYLLCFDEHVLVFTNTSHNFSYLWRAYNWQKRKSKFFTCPCHKIYRTEAALVSPSNCTLRITILWVCEMWGNFVKNLYFFNNCLIKVKNLKSFCTYVTHIIWIIYRTPPSFLLYWFSVKYRFLILCFYHKIT